MNDTFMINICSLDIQKMGKSLENNVSFSSNCMLDLNLLKEHLMSVFSKEDIVNIGKERVVLTLDSTKIAILTDIVLIHYLEKEMKFRKIEPKKHWTILKINDKTWGYFNLRNEDDALVHTFYSVYLIAQLAVKENRILYISSLPYDEYMSLGINKED